VKVNTATGHESATLTVENTGDELTPERLATLVEPLRRGTERIHAERVGAGLGLAIVNSITNAHEGTLTSLLGPPAGSASQCNCRR
jgi:two-component system, OmpR family, sensor histidine kinase VanS